MPLKSCLNKYLHRFHKKKGKIKRDFASVNNNNNNNNNNNDNSDDNNDDNNNNTNRKKFAGLCVESYMEITFANVIKPNVHRRYP